jgi:hypothetical protein
MIWKPVDDSNARCYDGCMPKIFFLLSLGMVVLASTAAAAEQGGVMIRQMSPASKYVVDTHTETAATPAEAEPATTVGDDLKTILQDHKISELGRANQAISSQYGGQAIVETGEPATKAGEAQPLKVDKKYK